MGDVRSIFDRLKTAPPTAGAPAVEIEPPRTLPVEHAALGALAQDAIRAADAARVARWAYQRKLDELMADVNTQVDDLRAEAERAQTDVDRLSKELCDVMTAKAIDAIALPDRPAIRIKVTAGARGTVTKKLLEEVLPKSDALKVWNAVKRAPDKREVVLPQPHEPT
jgi:hypothetical protein